MADVRVRPISSGEVIYDTLRMTQTLLPAILLVTGLLQGVQSQSCNPACSSDELCNFGVCQQVTNCECVVHNKADKCDYTRRTGNDAQACKDAGCCWNAAKTKCQKKNAEQQPSGDACTRMIPKADRTFAGWYKIAPSDCMCMGGCYDGDSSGNYKCFEPASPKSSACPPGMYYKEGLDSCYLQVTERKTWDESQQHCARLSSTAHMVEVGSQAEHDYVKKVMDGRHMWYGARRVSGGGVNDIEWTHSGTTVKSFTNWECNQPDQQSDGSQNAADCVIGYSQYRWYDTSCDRKVASLCEASPVATLGLGDKCKTTDVCSPANSVCDQGVCKCSSRFKLSAGQCVVEPSVVPCRTQKLDLIFVADNSGSINGEEMKQQKEFFTNMAYSFTISNSDTRIGFIKFGTKAVVISDLNSRNTAGDVNGDIQKLAQCVGGKCDTGSATNIGAGLDAMTQMFTSSSRSGHRKVAIVLTDGKSNSGSLPDATKRVPKDVTVFAVGVDGAVQSELEQIAGSDDRVFKKDNFKELAQVVNDLRKKVCTGGPTPPPRTCPAGMTKHDGHCYAKVGAKKNFDDAQAHCRSAYGSRANLVSIESDAENTYVKSLVTASSWLGARAKHTGVKDFYWPEGGKNGGPAFSYANWNSGEPNNVGGDPNEDCVNIYTSGTWNDLKCSALLEFVCEDSLDGPATLILSSCPGGMITHGSSCYVTVQTRMKFDAAQSYCRNNYKNGHLVSIEDAAENVYVQSLTIGSTWLGGRAQYTGIKKFYWQEGGMNDGPSFSYTNWHSGEPNNVGGDPNEDCIEMYTSGLWNDMKCSADKYFICEGSNGNPSYVDPCPSGMALHDSMCYAKLGSRRKFADAQALCRSTFGSGANLPSVEDAAENRNLRSVLTGSTWLGGRAISTGNKIFYWQEGGMTGGPPFGYQNWQSGEPNNVGGDPNEDCIEIYTSGTWNDIKCSADRDIVCLDRLGAPTKTPICPSGMVSHASSCYAAVHMGMNFDAAQSYCRTRYRGGNLVSISDSAENAYVRSLIKASSFTGGRDKIPPRKQFYWQEGGTNGGPAYSYHNWQSGEPNNVGGDPNEDCIEIYTSGFWNDIRCSASKHFVCEA